ncbi:MAG: hypothetical protein N2688_12855, partial [Burkholderiaceae bacterium]|nr:hypothetical protein [Burkholderiaceae bacterium]
MKIATRFQLTFGVGLAALAIVAAAAGGATFWLAAQTAAVYRHDVAPLAELGEVRDALQAGRLQAFAGNLHNPQYAVSRLHDHPLSTHTDAIEASISALRRASQALSASAASEQRRYAELSAQISDYIDAVAQPLADLLKKAQYD